MFNRIVQQQLKEAQCEKEHDKCRHRANLQHAQDIRAQIRKREQVRFWIYLFLGDKFVVGTH